MGPTDVYRGLEWEGGHFARTCLESRPQSDDNVMRHELEAEATKSQLSPIFVVLVLTTVGAVAMCVESKRARAGSPTVHSPPIHLAPIIPKRLSRRPYHTPAFKLRKRGWTRPTSLETWPRARRHRQAARDGPTFTPPSSSQYSGQHTSGRESFSYLWALRSATDGCPTASYEDFAECFSLWCDEQPENAATIFNLVSGRLESSITVRLCSFSSVPLACTHREATPSRRIARNCSRSTT